MADIIEFFPLTLEGGTRTYADGIAYVELRFAEHDGRTAAILISEEAMQNLRGQLAMLAKADFDPWTKPN